MAALSKWRQKQENEQEKRSEFRFQSGLSHRVARWCIFKPKIPIWVNFGGPWNGKVWYSLWQFEIYITAIWYILWPFGNLAAIWCNFPLFWVHCVKKNLATLFSHRIDFFIVTELKRISFGLGLHHCCQHPFAETYKLVNPSRTSVNIA
jgi:hypothetical protein